MTMCIPSVRKWWQSFRKRHTIANAVDLWGDQFHDDDTPKTVDVVAQHPVEPRIKRWPFDRPDGTVERGWWISGHNDGEIVSILILESRIRSHV